MKIGKLCILLCFFSSIAFAENSAITKTNYTAGGTYTDFLGSHYSVNGRVAAPFGTYGGASLNADYSVFNAEGSYIDSKGWLVGGEIFLGDHNKGRVGVGYNNSRSDFGGTTNDFGIDSEGYDISLDVYVNDITFGIMRYVENSEVDDPSVTLLDDRTDGLFTRASYYYGDNFKIEAGIGSMDLDEIYTLGAGYLPDLMKKKLSIMFIYTKIPDDDGFTNDDYVLSVDFKYYFTDTVSFKDRDRHY